MEANLRQVWSRRKALAFVLVLCTAMLGSSCQAPKNPPPRTLLFRGGTVLTMDSTRPTAAELSVEGDRITALSDTPMTAPLATVVDLGGMVLAPALVDHHVHLFNVGLTLLNDRDHERIFVDLANAASLTDVYEKIHARASQLPAGTWIVGAGWNQAAWNATMMPNADTLNRAAPDHPVYLSRSDGHAGWVNVRAMELAGINARTVAPDGGVIVRDRKGAPSGILLERANELMTPFVPPIADSDVVAAFRLAAEGLAARGVTRVYDAGVLPLPGLVALNAPLDRYLSLLIGADARAALPLEINIMIPAPSALADSLLAAAAPRWVLSPRLRITHLKLFADGTLGSRGAALSHPYADDSSTHGVPRMSASEIASSAIRALDAGLGVATHAIGDEAVRRTLDAYDRVLAKRPNAEHGRLRIEHFSYAREEDFARALKLGVILSMQSGFNSGAGDTLPFGSVRVGASNELRVYAWSRLARAGARLADGSDYFTRPGKAMYNFDAALTRRHGAATDVPGAAGREFAYRMQSRWFKPDGQSVEPMLRAGASADLVILSANPLTTPVDALLSIDVMATIHDGRVTYAAPRFTSLIPTREP